MIYYKNKKELNGAEYMRQMISNHWRCGSSTVLEFAHDFMLLTFIIADVKYVLTRWHGKHMAAPPSIVFVTLIEKILATSSPTLMLWLLWPSCNFWNAQLKVYESFSITEWKNSCLDWESVHLCINVTPLESDPYICKREQGKWCIYSGSHWKTFI